MTFNELYGYRPYSALYPRGPKSDTLLNYVNIMSFVVLHLPMYKKLCFYSNTTTIINSLIENNLTVSVPVLILLPPTFMAQDRLSGKKCPGDYTSAECDVTDT